MFIAVCCKKKQLRCLAYTISACLGFMVFSAGIMLYVWSSQRRWVSTNLQVRRPVDAIQETILGSGGKALDTGIGQAADSSIVDDNGQESQSAGTLSVADSAASAIDVAATSNADSAAANVAVTSSAVDSAAAANSAVAPSTSDSAAAASVAAAPSNVDSATAADATVTPSVADSANVGILDGVEEVHKALQGEAVPESLPDLISHDSRVVRVRSTSAFALVRVPKSAMINKTVKGAMALHQERHEAILERSRQLPVLNDPLFRNGSSLARSQQRLEEQQKAHTMWRWPNLCDASKTVPPGLTENGTIAVLLRTSSVHEMRELTTTLLPSLVTHLRFKCTVTLMYEGKLEPLLKAVKPFNSSKWFHIVVTEVTHLFKATQADYDSIGAANRKRMRMVFQSRVLRRIAMSESAHSCKGQTMGYRKMCEFWVVHVHSLPVFEGVRYIWRMDTDSQLTADVSTSVFGVLYVCGAVFGYGHHMRDHIGCCMGLKERTFKFFNNSEFKVPDERLKAMGQWDAQHCPAWNTHFQMMDLDFFRGNKAYNAYVNAIRQELIGFRWGDHIVQSFFLRATQPPERYLCMQPWVPGYVHQEVGMEPHCFPPALSDVESIMKTAAKQEALRWKYGEWHFKVPCTVSKVPLESTRNSSIVVLVNTESTEDMSDLSKILLPSVASRVHFYTYVTLLYRGDEGKLKQLTRLHADNQWLNFTYMNVTADETISKTDKTVTLNPKKIENCARFSKQHKLVSKFWLNVHKWTQLSEFAYLWRLAPASRLTQDVNSNVYNVMRACGATFAYMFHTRDVSKKCSSCRGLSRLASDIHIKDPQVTPKDGQQQSIFHTISHKFDNWRCPAWTDDFMIIDATHLRKSFLWSKFQRAKSRILTMGWSEIAIRSLFYRIDYGRKESPAISYVPASRVLCMARWVPGYEHRGVKVSNSCWHNWPESFW